MRATSLRSSWPTTSSTSLDIGAREDLYDSKFNRDESSKGCDVIGSKFIQDGAENPKDELFVFEAKAAASGKPKGRLQDAFDDSHKDRFREATSLNALKQRFFERGEDGEAAMVARFQNEPDKPFKRISGAAAVHDTTTFDAQLTSAVKTATHFNAQNLKLIVVTGAGIMALVHALYDRAANEA